MWLYQCSKNNVFCVPDTFQSKKKIRKYGTCFNDILSSYLETVEATTGEYNFHVPLYECLNNRGLTDVWLIKGLYMGFYRSLSPKSKPVPEL